MDTCTTRRGQLFLLGTFVAAGQDAQGDADGIVVFVYDALFEGNNRVVGDMDFLRAYFRAAFGDVA